MAMTSVEAMELEAISREDGSWHPCRISISSTSPNIGIIVDFGKGTEDAIYSREDALSRLRFRSTPLQGDECTLVRQGDRVLAMKKDHFKTLFFDAAIVEPKIVKHSRRVHCRCTFEIKWLSSDLEGESETVPSKSILKHCSRSIDDHPVVVDFLKALNSKNGNEVPSFLSFSEESSCEVEFVGILEKQVEEISKLVDGSTASCTDLFLELKSANVIDEKHNASLKGSELPKTNRHGGFGRTTRSRSKNQVQTEPPIESVDTPVLTPLAARAALASIVHELPIKSVCYGEDSQQEDATRAVELPASKVTNSLESNFFPHNEVSLQSKISCPPSKNSCIEVKHDASVASPQCNSERKHKSKVFLDNNVIQEKKMRASKGKYGIGDETIIPNSVSYDKLEISITTRRLTRSMQKKLDASSIEWKSSPEGLPSNPQMPSTLSGSALTREVLVLNEEDKVSVAKSPSFLLQKEVSVSSNDLFGGKVTKKSPVVGDGTGSTKPATYGERNNSNSSMLLEKDETNTDSGSIADNVVAPDKYEIKKRKLSAPCGDQHKASSERNVRERKVRTSSSSEADQDITMFGEQKPSSEKKKNASKNSTKRSEKSSPSLGSRPRTRSQSATRTHC